MSSPKTRTSRVFTISFPEELAKQVIAVAEDESRTISELFRQAFRVYLVDKMHEKMELARSEAALRGPQKYTEDDVEGLVDEIRNEAYLQRKKIA